MKVHPEIRCAPFHFLPSTLTALCATIFLAQDSGAQAVTREINRTASCTNCTVVPEKLFELGSATDPVYLSMNSFVVRDSRGRFFAKGSDNFRVVVFDSSGKFLRALGERGNGPGQFQHIRGIAIARGDSILIAQEDRIAVFSPEFVYSRTLSLGGRFEGMIALPDGNLLVAQEYQLGAAPFVMIAGNGSRIRGFGGGAGQCEECSRRSASVANSRGHVWLGVPNTYSMQLWDTTGTLVQSLTQTAEWFRQWNADLPVDQSLEEVFRKPRLMRMFEDTESRLWAQSFALDPGYVTPPPPAATSAAPAPTMDPASMENMMHRGIRKLGNDMTINRVEVFDTRTAQLIVSATLPDELGLMPGGFASMMREDSNGIVHWDIYRLSIRTR